MEQPFSTSKVKVEYFDPHDVYKLLAPGLIPRLPLRNLHWQSHAGPLRSIDTLHIELLPTGGRNDSSVISPAASPLPRGQRKASSSAPSDDGFQTQIGASASSDAGDKSTGRASTSNKPARRHQIPGLSSTPYLKVLLVRCDDNDSYKGGVRAEVREWVKNNTPPSGSKKTSSADNHDAYEWLIVHVVIPNTVAATQPRKSDSGSGGDKPATSRWRPGSSTLLEKFRSDFNSSSKGGVDRIAQIRIGVNDVPYDLLPRVVPAVPTGYTETEQDSENAWNDLITKFRSLILSSFDTRVTQYEEDIKEKDGQRSLPGWNFCTFFILKEGLARGFESVGLVEDALVGYDELSVGLDMIVQEQVTGQSRSSTSALLNYTEELKKIAIRARAAIAGEEVEDDDEEVVDMQSAQETGSDTKDSFEGIAISAVKKPYRDLILANNVSVFDFRCYVFARQLALLLRLGNAWSTREELLAKLKEQQESIMPGVAPRAPPPKHKDDEREDLTMLSEVCRRTLAFIPTVSQVMRNDITCALREMGSGDGKGEEEGTEDPVAEILDDPIATEVVDNMVSSFAFSIAQQILAQTSTKSLPIPPSSMSTTDSQEPKAAIPEPKTMMHPARNSSLRISTGGAGVGRPPPSPNIFPTGRRSSQETVNPSFLKAGLEDLAARRAELYALSRNVLEECGKKRAWSDGWSDVPVVGESTMVDMVDIDLGDDEAVNEDENEADKEETKPQDVVVSVAGIDSPLFRTALADREDFYRLYETLTEKALRHYIVSERNHSVQTCMADIAVLKYHLGDYEAAASYFWRTTPFFGESGWSLLELSMLIMYSRCLKELKRGDEYVKVMLKLLSKAAVAEKERQCARSSIRIGKEEVVDYPDSDAIKGLMGELLAETKVQKNEVRMPLSGFFSRVAIDGHPEYHDGRDTASMSLKLESLLADAFEIERARVRVSNTGSGSQKEIWFESVEVVTISRGMNKLKLSSNTIVPGSYEIDRIDLIGSNLHLHYEREVGQVPDNKADDILKSPHISLYHRADTFDVRLRPSRHIQLDRNSMVDVELDSGWNEITSVEVRVKAATGGLRMLTTEAKCVGNSSIGFSKPPEGGLFSFQSIPRHTTFRVRFPYNVEHDVAHVSIRIEATYTTEHGTFAFSKTPSIPIALSLGVNVQDIFKHDALFSRFTVSTSTHSPLRLYKSELLESDVFESAFGVAPNSSSSSSSGGAGPDGVGGDPIVIFSRQPASLLYRITRKRGVDAASPTAQKTLYLRLQYSVLQDEVEALFEAALTRALRGTPLQSYARHVVSTALPCVSAELGAQDLERAALVGAVPTSLLSSVDWARASAGLGSGPGGARGDVSTALASFMRDWQARNPRLEIPGAGAAALRSAPTTTADVKSILIPVDIPSVSVVHTADIRLQQPPDSNAADPASAVFCTNQLIPATLHLRWTRAWDTATPAARQTDLEFSYEVVAPPLAPAAAIHHHDAGAGAGALASSGTWLLGGRRKGHFVIPAPSAGQGLSSTPDTEAEIPILMIPLREGWLPYPGIEIREVRPDPSELAPNTTNTNTNINSTTKRKSQPQPPPAPTTATTPDPNPDPPIVAIETDCRNIGETVRVVADRARVTLSLDAGGPGGGPLLLEAQPRWGVGGGGGGSEIGVGVGVSLEGRAVV